MRLRVCSKRCQKEGFILCAGATYIRVIVVLVFQASEVLHDGSLNPEAETRTMVVVEIRDVNDNAPTFPRNSYVTEVDEDETGSIFIRDLVVTDPDEVRSACAEVLLFSAGGAQREEVKFCPI